MKRRIATAAVAAAVMVFGGAAASAQAGEETEGAITPGLTFEQVAEAPACTPVYTESGGVVAQGLTNIPATTSGSPLCGQQASLPPTTMPAGAMPAPANTAMAEPRSPRDVYFALGSAWLSDRAITQVDYFTYYDLIKTPTQNIRITGYADEQGSPQYNLWLSKRRAEAVAAYMETKGVPRSRMIITGAGSLPGGNPAGNRKVEVVAE